MVNRNSGLAFAVDDSVCANGMSLTLVADDHTSLTQQFYLGQHGSIFSAKCRGLVIEAIDMDSVQLQILRVKDNTQKWKFTNGMIENVLHPGMVLAKNDKDAIILKSNSESKDQSLNWIRVNTRLLDSTSATSDWKQAWKTSYIDPDYKGPSIEKFIQNNNALTKHASPSNPTSPPTILLTNLPSTSPSKLPSISEVGVQKVKIQHDRSSNEFLNILEVEVYDQSGTNQALNKPASQSSTYNSLPASQAVDGNHDEEDLSHTNFSHTKNGSGK